MAVNTIGIPVSLRDLVDEFILADPAREHGGFLFGTPLRFETFLPVPNVSKSPQNQYKMPENWPSYSRAFSEVVGCEAVTHVHTHPKHSIPSEQDFRSMEFWFRHVHYQVLVAPNAEAAKTTWWVLDERAEVQELISLDEELEAASLLFARRFGFADLGTVLMDHEGHLRSQGRIPQALIENTDARTLYTGVLGQKRYRRLDTKKQLQDLSGLSPTRTGRALEVLSEAGLIEVPKSSWQSFKVVDIFGRRFD